MERIVTAGLAGSIIGGTQTHNPPLVCVSSVSALLLVFEVKCSLGCLYVVSGRVINFRYSVIFEFQHRLSFPFKCHQVNRSRCHHSVPTHIRRPHHSVHTHIRCSTSLLHVKNCSCRHSSSWPSIIEARETTLLLNHSSSITLPQLLFLSYSCSITLAQSLLLCSEIKRHNDISGTRHVDNRPEITADIDDLIARNWRRDDTSIFVHFCCLLLTGYKLLVSLAANDYWLSVCSFYPTRLRSGVSVSGLQN